jgi:hypothetical protein
MMDGSVEKFSLVKGYIYIPRILENYPKAYMM